MTRTTWRTAGSLYRRTLGGERQRSQMRDPMAVDVTYGRRRVKREEGEERVVSRHRIQLGCGVLAGSLGTGRSNLSRETLFSVANGNRENSVIPVQLTTSRIGNQSG